MDALPLIDGRYRLLRLLAIGGMGELYLATVKDDEIEGLEQLVVIKRILPEYAADPNVVTMFLIEARIAARLDHPNVVRVYDMGRADGSIYFTMEHLHGADLGRVFDALRAAGAHFPLGHALTVILAICEGLHFAHEMRRIDGRPLGIVHRDVSPSNVFITYQGEVKLVDFGIAKVMSSTQHTQAGVRKGKVAYMSPEQVRGEPVDRRSDIFAIGILLYEMVTMTHLFDGDNEYEIMEQVAGGYLPLPSTRRPGIHPALETIIVKALAFSPKDRYQTADELAEDLEWFARERRVALSLAALRQFLRRTVGVVDYPWYSDEEDPAQAEAVEHWFRGAQPELHTQDVGDIDLDLGGGDLDDDLGGADEPAPENPYDPYDEPTPPPLPRPLPQVRRPLPPVQLPPFQQLSPPPPPPPTRDMQIARAVILGSAAALLLIAAALALRSCRERQPDADAAPPPAPTAS